jgi:glucoside 3-dehydrogenase (cytochrome c) hitch-hiker subunit
MSDDVAKRGRRDALKAIVAGAGGLSALPILGQAQPAQAAQHELAATAAEADATWKPDFFDEHQNETIITLTDLIIPQTDTPGAKAALVNRYLDLKYHEEEPEKQKELINGLAWLDGRSLSRHSKPFVRLSEAEQIAMLEPLADPRNSNPEDLPGVEFFQLIKELTIFGYYTSEIGLDRELQYAGDTYNASFPEACTHPEHQS